MFFKIIIMTLLFSKTIFAKYECGVIGTVEDRIKDCQVNKPDAKRSRDLHLVTNSRDGHKIYLDKVNDLVWSDDFDPYSGGGRYSYQDAIEMCQSRMSVQTGEDLNNVEWNVPAKEQYKLLFKVDPYFINKYGDEDNIIDRGKSWAWARDTNDQNAFSATVVDIDYEYFYDNTYRNQAHYVRCVGKRKSP